MPPLQPRENEKMASPYRIVVYPAFKADLDSLPIGRFEKWQAEKLKRLKAGLGVVEYRDVTYVSGSISSRTSHSIAHTSGSLYSVVTCVQIFFSI